MLAGTSFVNASSRIYFRKSSAFSRANRLSGKWLVARLYSINTCRSHYCHYSISWHLDKIMFPIFSTSYCYGINCIDFWNRNTICQCVWGYRKRRNITKDNILRNSNVSSHFSDLSIVDWTKCLFSECTMCCWVVESWSVDASRLKRLFFSRKDATPFSRHGINNKLQRHLLAGIASLCEKVRYIVQGTRTDFSDCPFPLYCDCHSIKILQSERI